MMKRMISVSAASMAILAASVASGASRNAAAIPASRILAKLWTQPGTFESVKFAVLLGDTLYVGGTPRGLEARSLSNGTLKWKYIGKYLVDAPPCIRGGVLYLREGGRLVTLDAASGKEKMRLRTRVGAVTRIFPGEAAWVVGASDERIYGIVPRNGLGIRSWRLNLGDSIAAATWDAKSLAYFLTMDGRLYALSIPTATFAWQYKFRYPECSIPVLAGDTVYVGCADFRLYALDAASGNVKWALPLSGPVTGTPVAARGRVYVSTADGLLNAVDAKERKVLWTVPDAARVITTTEEHVIFLRRRDDTHVIGVANASDGKIITEVTAARYVLFPADPEAGTFYAVTRTGGVTAVADRGAVKENLKE